MLIPTNEQGVVSMFSYLHKELGFEIVSIGTLYPDCIAEKNGKRVRIEFEYVAQNFIRHGHDPAGADLIVCWRQSNGRKNPLPIEVLELEKVYKHLKEKEVREKQELSKNRILGDIGKSNFIGYKGVSTKRKRYAQDGDKIVRVPAHLMNDMLYGRKKAFVSSDGFFRILCFQFTVDHKEDKVLLNFYEASRYEIDENGIMVMPRYTPVCFPACPEGSNCNHKIDAEWNLTEGQKKFVSEDVISWILGKKYAEEKKAKKASHLQTLL
jgi:hypothetical protein